jgi:putative MFS transporter
METAPSATSRNLFHLTVIVASLGYFVDIYDLLLFGIVRVPSLKDLGVSGADLLSNGLFLINMQMGGMILGGIIWGILGDKRGRLAVLFGSILLYSIANILNAMVSSVGAYAALRFLAGIGLAGELGAAITLVSETLHQSKRGYGTALVAGIGILGAIAAGFVARLTSWRTAYVIGGVLGLGLLILRVSVAESGMYEKLKSSSQKIRRGDLRLLFSTRERAVRYLSCILTGVPVWFVIGILVTFSPEFAKELGVTGAVSAGTAIMFCYAGASLGDFMSGALSQFFGSRKKVLFSFQVLTAVLVPVFLNARGVTPELIYVICALIGFAAGYWAVFVTIASEQFGTNLRATVTSTVPNFVRGSVVPMTAAFQLLKSHYTLAQSAGMVGVVVFTASFWALSKLGESSQRDLNFLEV